MNGPEHYREAEQRLAQAHAADNSEGFADYLLAKAQVHATLALAAAQVTTARASAGSTSVLAQWSGVTA